MSGEKYDRGPIHIEGNIWLARQMTFCKRQDGSQLVNVCVKNQDGILAAVEVMALGTNGIYSYKDKAIGTIDSPEFARFISKYQDVPDMPALSSKPAAQNDKELYERVSGTYAETKSIKKSAKLLGISEEKTRRILFTLGEYTCDMHEKIMKLLKEGKPLDDVSEAVGLSRHKVHSYLPYV